MTVFIAFCTRFLFFVRQHFCPGRVGTRMGARRSAAVSRRRKAAAFVLAFVWILGIASGIVYSRCPMVDVVSLMRGALNRPVSIVSFLCTSLLPFVMSAILAFLDCPLGIYGICFWKAFLHGFVSAGLITCFPDWGWLMRCFLLLGDGTLPILYWLWLRCVQNRSVRIPLVISGCGQLVIIAAGYGYVFPFYWRFIESLKG